MKKILLCLIAFHCVFSFSDLMALGAAKRYAMVVGANNGGRGRVLLKYAVSDAASFNTVMVELGGLSRDDSFTAYNPDRRTFYSTFNQLITRIENDKGRYRKQELFFYYSGHSDETGLLLGEEKVTYDELRQDILGVDIDVRIVILDSCSSGAFTRIKGGEMMPAFMADGSYDMKGNAFLTSSSADEASQESDRIRGSFFTHYLIAGMRGAADVTQNRRITLNEVYQFAYNSTLVQTQATRAGAQHPNYHIEMVGTGDVILTDVRRSSSILVIDEEIEGTVLVVDSRGKPLAEFNKSYGHQVELGVPPGDYSVVNSTFSNRVNRADITVRSGVPYRLTARELMPERLEWTRRRGDDNDYSAENGEREESTRILNYDEHGSYLLKYGEMRFSGYGAPAILMTRIAGEPGVFVGGKGGLIINNSFVIGGGGYGLVHPMRLNVYTDEQLPESETYLHLGFGGFMMEYYYRPRQAVTYSLGLTIGAGSYVYSDFGDHDQQGDNANSFFSLYPEVNAYLTLTRFARFGTGVGYTYFSGIDSDYIKDSDFTGLAVSFVFQFGWF